MVGVNGWKKKKEEESETKVERSLNNSWRRDEIRGSGETGTWKKEGI